MINTELVFIFLGFFILYVFLFNRKLLVHQKFSNILWVICLVFFVLGLLLEKKGIKGSEALKIPMIQYALYRFFRHRFYKLYKREPKDTFWTMEKGVWKDAVFNVIFWLLAFLLPTILVFTGTV